MGRILYEALNRRLPPNSKMLVSQPEPMKPPSIDEQFRDAVGKMAIGSEQWTAALSKASALKLFVSQATSRQLDFAGRWLRARGEGYYTIASAGHEGNAAVAEALRVDDPAFLHYRSGAFFVHRAARAGMTHAVRDVLLGMVASSEEPIAGGRHKVFGSVALHIPPQTSTIASHLPKAVGTAFALHRAHRIGCATKIPRDAIVMCSFGDASINHSTAAGAINAACHIAYQSLPLPLLFVCEDNGLGISVRTPEGWIEHAYGARPGLEYYAADGCDVADAYDVARAAVDCVRERRQPALLHLRTVRLMAHAGSDVEIAYRSVREIFETEARDPLIQTARLLVESGAATPDELLDQYDWIHERVFEQAREATRAPKLASAAQIARPLAPRTADAVRAEALRPPSVEARVALWGDRLPEQARPGTLSFHINSALGDLLAKYPEAWVFGEDVGRKGGVYGVTKSLAERAGPARVVDTLLDEQTILGLAMGSAHVGMLPLPEIQYLAYLHNAEDQLRGEAATLQFFSQGGFRNPMVLRVASFAYQKGFGGHFHNDNAVGVLRDIPGIVVAVPSCGPDAAAMLRTCAAAARVDGAVCVFLEPIALYGVRDLHGAGDGEYAHSYAPEAPHVAVGEARTYGDGTDVLVVSFANGVRMSRRVARRVERSRGVRCAVLDLRWIAPLPVADLVAAAGATRHVLIVDETRRSGGVSEGVITALTEAGFDGTLRRVASEDSFIPLGDAANHVLVSEAAIEAALVAMGR